MAVKPDILYEDNHLLVINKPAGLLAQADQTGDPDVLTLGRAYLKQKYQKPGKVFLALVHRLDRPVSGVMVLARTSKAAQRLTTQFQKHQPEKRYWAIVEGRHTGSGAHEDYLVKVAGRVRMVRATHPQGKRARLQWQTIGIAHQATLFDIALTTGRPHQIRVQLAHHHQPILGDLRYGAKRRFDGRNLALHCYQMTLQHPTQKIPMTWRVQPPAPWRGWFDGLRMAAFAATGVEKL